MKIDFTVDSIRDGHVSIDAMIGDTKQKVLVDGTEVTFISDTGRSLTLPFHGSSLEEARKIFQPGKMVYFNITE